MSKKTYTAAITGAGGFLGTELVNYFSKKGWNVRAFARKPSDYWKKNVQFVQYNMEMAINDDALRGCDFVIHAAYIKQDKQHPRAIDQNIFAAKNIITASKKVGVRKSLFISSMSAHEDALSVYGKQKLQIESLFNAAGGVTIRSGMIIGNGGIVLNMANLMKKLHAVPLIGNGTQPIQIVGVYDLVVVIEAVLLEDSLKGTYTIATPRVYTYKEFYSAVARHLKLKILFVPVPYRLLLMSLRVVGVLRLPLNVGEENLLGMKMLRSVKTTADLVKIGITLDELDVALTKSM